jgi:hypothetical protein
MRRFHWIALLSCIVLAVAIVQPTLVWADRDESPPAVDDVESSDDVESLQIESEDLEIESEGPEDNTIDGDEHDLADTPSQPTDSPAVPLRLMSPDREALYRKCLPAVEDPAVADLLTDERLVLYSEHEMPKAYQFWEGAFPGVHSARYNISANGSEPFGNGNREFPWAVPAGTHRAVRVSSFRFFRLPDDDEGRLMPVVWYRKRSRTDNTFGYGWTFPVGTVFGEVLMLKGPSGLDYTFELRIRRREVGCWQVDAFRPFPTAASLAQRIKELRPDWQERVPLAELCGHLEGPRKLPVQTLADRQPHRRVFQQTMGVDSLPATGDDSLVEELLTGTTFRSVLGATWRDDADGVETCAPTTEASFHVVPASYDGGFVAVDDTSCMRCHETANASVRQFDASRDWYGRVRGSDGIFSFHPFSIDSVSNNGYARTVRMRRELERAGALVRYDPARHPASVYQSLVNSRE